jgi:threonine aldolase
MLDLVASIIVTLFALGGVLLVLLQFPGIWVALLAALACQWWRGDLFSWWTLGAVALIAALAEVAEFAASTLGLPVHLDGARLWNAHVATGTPLPDFGGCADTVMVSFSKGLGAPVGAALAGPAPMRERAWTIRKRLGGGMRQSGILAAAALHALEHHLPELGADHAKAREIAARVAAVPRVHVVPPDTHIVMVDLPPGSAASDVVAACARAGSRSAPRPPRKSRPRRGFLRAA